MRQDHLRSDDLSCQNLYLNRRERNAVRWFIWKMLVNMKKAMLIAFKATVASDLGRRRVT